MLPSRGGRRVGHGGHINRCVGPTRAWSCFHVHVRVGTTLPVRNGLIAILGRSVLPRSPCETPLRGNTIFGAGHPTAGNQGSVESGPEGPPSGPRSGYPLLHVREKRGAIHILW